MELRKGHIIFFVLIVTFAASIALFALDEGPVLPELKKLNLEAGQPVTQSKERLPEAASLTGPYWGLMKNVCEKGGYDLAAFAGKDVVFSRFPLKKKENLEPLDVCVYSTQDKIACVFLLNTDPSVAGSMYPVQAKAD